MYKIVGADGKEYGPVNTEDLRQWIKEGRANSQTQVMTEGGTEWKRLGTLAEFADAFAAAPPPPLSPMPVAGPATGKTNGMAVAGLILGVVGLFCCMCGPLFSTLGLVFSCIGLSQINRDPTQQGRSLAIAGIVLAVLGYAMFIGVLAMGGLRRGLRRRAFRL